jgi:hypothetical protein
MIRLDENTNTDFDLSISLDDILDLQNRFGRYHGEHNAFNYSCDRKLVLHSQIGNATFRSHFLIHYPQLSNALRKLKSLTYIFEIELQNFPQLKTKGLRPIIETMQAFDECVLQPHRIKKSVLDAEINNLVMLYGQEKTIPIYQGSKPYYSLKKTHLYKRHGCISQQIKLSGVNYYFHLISKRFKPLEDIYELDERMLFKPYIEACRLNVMPTLVDYGNRITFMGGIINTPLIAFHVKKTYKHKGRRFFLDLHTNQVYSRLGDVHEVAKGYSQNYKILLHEDKKQ